MALYCLKNSKHNYNISRARHELPFTWTISQTPTFGNFGFYHNIGAIQPSSTHLMQILKVFSCPMNITCPLEKTSNFFLHSTKAHGPFRGPCSTTLTITPCDTLWHAHNYATKCMCAWNQVAACDLHAGAGGGGVHSFLHPHSPPARWSRVRYYTRLLLHFLNL